MAYPDFNMEHQWLPFTPNRSFAKNPRVFVAADGAFSVPVPSHVGGNVLVMDATDALGSSRSVVRRRTALRLFANAIRRRKATTRRRRRRFVVNIRSVRYLAKAGRKKGQTKRMKN